jgi:very-short-patch-repair endonuclease
MAATLWAGPKAAASHRSAAALWEFPHFPPDLIELSTPQQRMARGDWPILHRVRDLRATDIASIAEIPVTSPARTLLDICGLVRVIEPTVVEEALDDALRRELTSLPRLRWTAERVGRGKPGSTMLKELLRRRAPGFVPPDSQLESMLLRVLRNARLPEPSRQHEIREMGKLLARVDIAYPDVQLAIEADGYRYHSGRIAWQKDLARRNALTSRGWRILHVTWEDLRKRRGHVVEEIRRTLSEASSK